jgi:hypothetical protein
VSEPYWDLDANTDPIGAPYGKRACPTVTNDGTTSSTRAETGSRPMYALFDPRELGGIL